MDEYGSPPSTSVVRVKRAATGGAVGRLDDGRVVFVRHCLPGELVEVEITERSRSFARGDAVQILEPSPQRVTAPCRYATVGGCGGCDLQHATDDAQRAWKSAVVAEHLRRIAGVTRDVTVEGARDAPRGSRTRLRCAVTEDGRLGLRKTRSHDVIALESCWIADDRLRPAFAAAWPEDDEVELRALGDGEPFVVARRDGVEGPVIELRSLTGQRVAPDTHSEVVVDDHRFVVSPTSFWQSHRSAPVSLSRVVAQFADVQPGDTVVDLFSGVGLFAVPLAEAVGPTGRVIAVESSATAARDARVNASEMTNLVVREWVVSSRAVNDTVSPGDVVVLDPPRHGLPRGVAPALVRRQPRRLIYVSCDAATFARDLKVFLAGGFVLRDLRVLDLFPMTEHVELVGLLDFTSREEESGLEGADADPRGG
jgi:tRNA/tmRNA/rRNA uracil-C5-methylase (TrmA/RlmC/RlmD family)